MLEQSVFYSAILDIEEQQQGKEDWGNSLMS